MTRPRTDGAYSIDTPLAGGMRSSARNLTLAALTAAVGFVLPSCSSTIAGTPVVTPPPPAVSEPSFPPGLSIITEPPPAETPMSSYTPPSSAEQAVQRAVAFWNGAPNHMGLHATARAVQPPLVCATKTFRTSSAASCADGTVLYDAAWAQGLLRAAPNGPIALQAAMAHEIGHSIQSEYGAGEQLEAAPSAGGVAALELSADCYAGMYMHSTGLSTELLDAALALTPLGEPARTTAFHDGLATTDPNVCVDRYLS